MNAIKSAIAALAAMTCVGAAMAVPVTYQGTLVSGVNVTGSVGGTSWADEVAADVDFWRFTGVAGQRVSFGVTAGNVNFDPAFSLYFGTTTAEQAFFLNDSDWGGLVFLTSRDDDTGPGGRDPALVAYVLPFSGAYTVAIGGFVSSTSNAYPYSASFVTAQAVPEPETVVLLTAGLFGVVWSRRRARRAAAQ